MRKDRVILVALLTILFSISFFGGCIEEKSEAPEEIDFWRGELSTSGDLRLNREFDLEFSVTPIEDVSGVSLKFFLPKGIKLVSGDTQWIGDLKKNEPFMLSLTILVAIPGEWEISIWIESQNFPSFNRAYFGYITSTAESGEFLVISKQSTHSKSETEEENGGAKDV